MCVIRHMSAVDVAWSGGGGGGGDHEYRHLVTFSLRQLNANVLYNSIAGTSMRALLSMSKACDGMQ